MFNGYTPNPDLPTMMDWYLAGTILFVVFTWAAGKTLEWVKEYEKQDRI